MCVSDTINMEEFCRTCLQSPPKLLPLFSEDDLTNKIEIISSVTVKAEDDLCSTICEECVRNINMCYNFRNVIINNDVKLRERHKILKREKENEIKVLEQNAHIDVNMYDTYTNTAEIYKSSDTENDVEIKSEVDENEVLHVTAQDVTKKQADSLKILMYNRKTYSCSRCTFASIEYSEWKHHKQTHEYPSGICNICGKSIRIYNLSKHIKQHSEPPIPCGKCGKVLKNSESLRSHKMLHSEVDFQCKVCGKTYKRKNVYNQHVRNHLSPRKKTAKCDICNKMFRDTGDLKKHWQTHTGERPYICTYCSKGFSSGSALKTHKRQHTNERPYVCEHCAMGFPQKVSLVTHIRSKHSKKKNSHQNKTND